MAYMRKSTTLLLFLLLVITLIAFGVSMFFYQGSVARLNKAINNRDSEIDLLTNQVAGLSLNLSNINEMLNLQIKREENLSGLFTGLRSEKDLIEDERRAAIRNLTLTQAELYDAKIKISDLEDDLSNINTKYTSLNISYGDILDDVNDICTKAFTLNVSECKKYD
jgi:chromosome segregation ATPase